MCSKDAGTANAESGFPCEVFDSPGPGCRNMRSVDRALKEVPMALRAADVDESYAVAPPGIRPRTQSAGSEPHSPPSGFPGATFNGAQYEIRRAIVSMRCVF